MTIPGLCRKENAEDTRMSKVFRCCIALGCQVLFLGDLSGANRLFFDNVALPRGGTEEAVFLKVDNDVPLLGFSFGVRYDPNSLTVISVVTDGTEAEEADLFEGLIDAQEGVLGYACILQIGLPKNVISPGTDHRIAKLVVDVIGAAGTSSQLVFEPVATMPPPAPLVRNVLTTVDGKSITPTSAPPDILPLSLITGNVTVEDRTPQILSLAGNEGEPGQVFEIVGDFFGEPGLAVSVCGNAASGALEEDGRTLLVTAPNCPSVGFASVEVCTARGCDIEAEGFRYTEVVIEKDFVRANANGDESVNISDGIAILIYLFQGGDTPTCLDALDANDSGDVDISDAVTIFNFLFLGIGTIPPPYPDPGKDPPLPLDTLPPCQ